MVCKIVYILFCNCIYGDMCIYNVYILQTPILYLNFGQRIGLFLQILHIYYVTVTHPKL